MQMRILLLATVCGTAIVSNGYGADPSLPPALPPSLSSIPDLPPLPNVGAAASNTSGAATNAATDTTAKAGPVVSGTASSAQQAVTAKPFPELQLPDKSSDLPSLPPKPILPGDTSSKASDDASPFDKPPPLTLRFGPEKAQEPEPKKSEPVKQAKEKPKRKPVYVATIPVSPSIRAYRSVLLPSTIYKKSYDKLNRHLPAAQYESEHNQLMILTAAHDDINGLRALLSEGRKVDVADASGDTPLLAAVRHNAINTARLLLAHHASIGVSDARGMSPLQISVQNNNYPMARALQTLGAPIVQVSNLP
jgi:hypothetical protein